MNTVITLVKLFSLFSIMITGVVTAARRTPQLPAFFSGSSSSVSDYVDAIYGGYWSYAGWQV